MKKSLLAVAAVSVLFAFNAEARDMRGYGRHYGKRHSDRVVVINKGHGHYRPRPRVHYSYSYAPHPVYAVYNAPSYYLQPFIQSIFFSNRNFSFGLSNFLW